MAGNTATLRLGADNQIPSTINAVTTSNIHVASTGTLDLAVNDLLVNLLTLEAGPLGGSQVTIGAGGTLTLTNNLTVHSFGGGGAAGCGFGHSFGCGRGGQGGTTCRDSRDGRGCRGASVAKC